MLTGVLRKLIGRRRLRAVRAWQEAERAQAAEHSDAVRRILARAERERAA